MVEAYCVKCKAKGRKMNRLKFLDYCKQGLIDENEDLKIIEKLINLLIRSLYKPVDNDMEFVVDQQRCEFNKVDWIKESINWGDLKCFEVKKENEKYRILIEEAGPVQCPTFCEYIKKYMESWGWEVKVETEW